MTAAHHVASPLGPLLAVWDGRALTHLSLPAQRRPWPPGARDDAAPFRALRDELDAYFAGARRAFETPVAPAGTPFQERVWALLRTVPYGTTTTYGALAARLGEPGAAQAVGAANGANPVAILVPCHRVVGAGGALTGYAGGLEAKRVLLQLEAPAVGLFA